ncbi:MAG: hypothetical protein AAGN66_06165 [Acidobacteriota bacterium]
MGYLILQMIVCLVLAFLLGAVVGWLLRSNKAAREQRGLERGWTRRLDRAEARQHSAEQRANDLEGQLADMDAKEPSADTESTDADLEAEVKRLRTELTACLESKAQPAAAVPGKDDLKKIRGIGPVLEAMLNGLGVTRFKQIAGWSHEDVLKFSDELDVFRGRIYRDDWIGGAKKEHEKAYGESL